MISNRSWPNRMVVWERNVMPGLYPVPQPAATRSGHNSNIHDVFEWKKAVEGGRADSVGTALTAPPVRELHAE